MARTLGLDIGSNSIGWALVDDDPHAPRIVGMGVRVFPEGVERDQLGAEHSKNEQRRDARGMRRQIARRARRKHVLRRALVEAGLYPSDPEAQRRLDALDPYVLRERAVRERLEPFEIGRVLIHLNQRRGFLSNRKADRSRKDDAKGMLKEISDLEAQLNGRTLGQHFAEVRARNPHHRVRGKHTRRSMYVEEFERIWEAQRNFHPDFLTDRLQYGRRGRMDYPRKPEPLKGRRHNSLLAEYGIHGILFFQRSLYRPKSVIGACELEPKQKRCPRADRQYQRFRILQEVNNLQVISARGEVRPLSGDERSEAIELLATKKERTFDELRKLLGLREDDSFNLERGERKKLLGMETDVRLSKPDLFGRAWEKRPETEKNAIVRSLIDDEEHVIREKAAGQWGCSEELAAKLANLDLGGGYASFSLVAVEKLLPHLERGLRLMGNDPSDSALHAAGYLRPDERVVHQRDRLPAPPDITNPLVRQALFEVRKLINAILSEYGKPDAIHIELAREVQGGLKQRQEYTRRIRERERHREAAASEIQGWGHKPTREAIARYLLWKEQREECLYSGRPISPAQLFGGEVQIDHILPYSRSLDDSLMNKVVCFRDENDAKAGRTPHEWLAEANPAKYEAILQRVARLPLDVRNGKRLKVAAERIELDEFINRQLADTAYISRQVRAYVQCLGTDVVCTKGQCTAELRRMWGLNEVLRTDGLNLKNREDHRHHAVDALVIALTDRSRLQQLARYRAIRNDAIRDKVERAAFAPPWDSFRDDAQAMVDAIHVSHRAERDIHGALHEETIYGAASKPHRATAAPRPHAKGWIEEDGVYVLRKPLEALSPSEVGKIRDARVRELVLERLRAHGIDPDSATKIPKSVWTEPLRMIGARGAEKSPDAPVIRKVRIVKRDETIQPIRDGERTAHVKPGNTHHIALFELPGSTPERPRRALVAVSMLEAAARAARNEPVIRRTHPTIPQARFLFSLSRGEMVLGEIRGRRDLYVFRTAASTQGQIYFYSHTDARPSATARKFAVMANTLQATKVAVDALGRIRRAND
jgi:CRISPR-associated endonuclease Csn1